MSGHSKREAKKEKDREKKAKADHRAKVREQGGFKEPVVEEEAVKEENTRKAHRGNKANAHGPDCPCFRCAPKRIKEAFTKVDQDMNKLWHEIGTAKASVESQKESFDKQLLGISEANIKDLNEAKKELDKKMEEDSTEGFAALCALEKRTFSKIEKVEDKVDANKKELERVENSAMKLIQDQKKKLDDYHTELIKLAKYVGNIYKFLEQNYKAQMNPDGTISKKGWK